MLLSQVKQYIETARSTTVNNSALVLISFSILSSMALLVIAEVLLHN